MRNEECTRESFGGGGRAGGVGDENRIPRARRRGGVQLGRGRMVRAFSRMKSQQKERIKRERPIFLRGPRKSGERALVPGNSLLLAFVTSQCAQAVLTGQVKLKGSWRGLRPPPLLSSPTAKELVPNTGVETLPKVQGPGETTAWKCLRQTRKKVRQPGSHGRPLARTPRSLANSCSCSWKTPEPAARYCTGTEGRREGSGQLGRCPGLRPRARREGAARARVVTCCQSATSSSSAQPEALRDAAAIPWGVALSTRPPWSWLRSGRRFPARPPAGGGPEKLGSAQGFPPASLLASSAATASVGNPGEGGWAVAAQRTCPRANPRAASGLVPGYTALRRLELRLLASCSQPALSAATETCALRSLPYIYWLLSSLPVTQTHGHSPHPSGPLAATAPAPPGGGLRPRHPPSPPASQAQVPAPPCSS